MRECTRDFQKEYNRMCVTKAELKLKKVHEVIGRIAEECKQPLTSVNSYRVEDLFTEIIKVCKE